jgi:hypothetical protein
MRRRKQHHCQMRADDRSAKGHRFESPPLPRPLPRLSRFSVLAISRRNYARLLAGREQAESVFAGNLGKAGRRSRRAIFRFPRPAAPCGLLVDLPSLFHGRCGLAARAGSLASRSAPAISSVPPRLTRTGCRRGGPAEIPKNPNARVGGSSWRCLGHISTPRDRTSAFLIDVEYLSGIEYTARVKCALDHAHHGDFLGASCKREVWLLRQANAVLR